MIVVVVWIVCIVNLIWERGKTRKTFFIVLLDAAGGGFIFACGGLIVVALLFFGGSKFQGDCKKEKTLLMEANFKSDSMLIVLKVFRKIVRYVKLTTVPLHVFYVFINRICLTIVYNKSPGYMFSINFHCTNPCIEFMKSLWSVLFLILI